MTKHLISIMLLLLVISASLAQKTLPHQLPSLKGKKVLIVYGGWPGHGPETYAHKVSSWLTKQEAIVILSDSLNVYSNEKVMDEIDLVIQSWTMGNISNEQINGLLKAVKNGTGIAGCHGGIGDSFRHNTKFQYMIGGQFVDHPGGFVSYDVNITDSKDPITVGIPDFKITTEQYYMHVDPNVRVMATTTFDGTHDEWIAGAVMPVLWKKNFGKGRVFYLSIGHESADLDLPEVWSIFTRGIRWASGSKSLPQENLIQPLYPSKTTN